MLVSHCQWFKKTRQWALGEARDEKPGSGACWQALVHNLQKVGVLQGSCHPLLICKLLVHCILWGKGPWCNVHVYLETLGKRSQKLDFDGQTNKSSHATERNGGCEGHGHCTLQVTHLYLNLLCYIQVFKYQWLLGVIDGVSQIKDLAHLDINKNYSLKATEALGTEWGFLDWCPTSKKRNMSNRGKEI